MLKAGEKDCERRKNENVKKSHEIKKRSNGEYDYLQNIMCEKLGTKVKIKKNKIEINFVNTNDLNRILEIMNIGG